MNAYSILYQFVKPYRRMIVWAIILTMVTTTIALMPPLIVRTLVDKVITQHQQSLLVPMLALFILIPLLAGGMRLFNDFVITLLGAKLVLDLRRRLYRHLQNLPLGFFDKTSTGMLMERLMGDVGQVQRLVTRQTITLITDIMACLVAILAMVWLNAQLALIPLLFVPLYVLTHRFFRIRVRRANERYRSKMDDISSTISERIRSTAIVKVFGQEQNESRRFVSEAHDAKEFGVQAYTYSVAFHTTASLQTWLARVGITLLGYYMIIQGRMTLGEVVAFGAYSAYLLGPAVRFAQISNMLEEVMVSVHRMRELLDEPVEPPDAPDAVHVGRLQGRVEIQDVCFEYESDQPVLKQLNLHVQAGTTIALVGHTGCGKTTFVSLLYRFYEPSSGRILIDGHDISNIVRKDLRRNMSLVPQDPVVFKGTVRENIAYGRPDASLEDVIAAARVAEFYEVAMALPEQFETKLGGPDAKLSVGQKQRLMVARAVLTDPAILVLDEATSNLDAESERALQNALDRLMANRTSFVIAHRLSTIVNADKIVVMDGGQIVEIGTHDELLEYPDGYYRQLYLRQFAKVA